jgi:SAM-dependent methyltransferase
MPDSTSPSAVSFGDDAQGYDANRPGYPAGTVRWLLGEPSASLEVVDLGAGTGLLTGQLVADGHRAIAVDPSLAMLRQLCARVPAPAARAEGLPIATETVDAVVAAQAWHWVEQRPGSAEVARVLRPAGVLGLVWYARDHRVDWIAEIDEVTRRPSWAGLTPRVGMPAPQLGPRLQLDGQRSVAHPQQLDVEGFCRLAATWSWVRTAPDREQLLAAVARIVRRVAGPRGSVSVPQVCECFRYRLAG